MHAHVARCLEDLDILFAGRPLVHRLEHFVAARFESEPERIAFGGLHN